MGFLDYQDIDEIDQEILSMKYSKFREPLINSPDLG